MPIQTIEGAGFDLRPYQSHTLDRILELYRDGTNRQLVAKATGMGKTITFSFLPERFPFLWRHGMLVVAHRRELVFQAAEKLQQVWPDARVEIDMADRKASPDADVVVASIQTLAHPKSRRLQKYDPRSRFGIVVIDEAHHCSEDSQYATVTDYFGVGPSKRFSMRSGADRLLLGVTATPNRHDGEGLHHFFDDITVNLDIRWGIENGWLVDLKAKRITTDTDISSVSTRGGDFAVGELEAAINTEARHEVIVKAFKEHGENQALAFCAGVEQAHTLAAAFNAYGVDARAVDASTDKVTRNWLVRRFKSGDLHVLVNVGVFTEGFDAPTCDTLLIARPTKSTTLYTQMIGRGTRPILNPTAETPEGRVEQIRASEKPHLTVIDFVDNVGRHDLMTVPRLFGLDKDFETDESITAAVQKVEALEEENPGKPFRKAKNLDEIQIIAESVSVWDVADSVEEVKDVSDLYWMQVADGQYRLQIPDEVRVGSDTVNQDVFVEIESDRLGRYHTRIVKRPVYRKNKLVVKPFEKEGTTYNTREEAFAACDRYVEQKHPKAMNLISRDQSWHKKPATSGQLGYLKSLGVHIPEGSDLTRGKASRLIAAAKAQSNH